MSHHSWDFVGHKQILVTNDQQVICCLSVIIVKVIKCLVQRSHAESNFLYCFHESC